MGYGDWRQTELAQHQDGPMDRLGELLYQLNTEYTFCPRLNTALDHPSKFGSVLLRNARAQCAATQEITELLCTIEVEAATNHISKMEQSEMRRCHHYSISAISLVDTLSSFCNRYERADFNGSAGDRLIGEMIEEYCAAMAQCEAANSALIGALRSIFPEWGTWHFEHRYVG